MAFFTLDEAISLSGQRGAFNAETASSILTERIVKAASNYDRWDIFLSHASRDARVVLGVHAALTSAGYKVYVDWLADKLLDRESVNAGTADVLRTRMRQSSSLLFLATESAPKSKWMPWELGYFDGYKPQHVAIFPVAQTKYSFVGQEYLLLYPWITLEYSGFFVAPTGSSAGSRDLRSFAAA